MAVCCRSIAQFKQKGGFKATAKKAGTAPTGLAAVGQKLFAAVNSFTLTHFSVTMGPRANAMRSQEQKALATVAAAAAAAAGGPGSTASAVAPVDAGAAGIAGRSRSAQVKLASSSQPSTLYHTASSAVANSTLGNADAAEQAHQSAPLRDAAKLPQPIAEATEGDAVEQGFIKASRSASDGGNFSAAGSVFKSVDGSDLASVSTTGTTSSIAGSNGSNSADGTAAADLGDTETAAAATVGAAAGKASLVQECLKLHVPARLEDIGSQVQGTAAAARPGSTPLAPACSSAAPGTAESKPLAKAGAGCCWPGFAAAVTGTERAGAKHHEEKKRRFDWLRTNLEGLGTKLDPWVLLISLGISVVAVAAGCWQIAVQRDRYDLGTAGGIVKVSTLLLLKNSTHYYSGACLALLLAAPLLAGARPLHVLAQLA